MDFYQRHVTILNMLSKGEVKCFVCERPVENVEDAALVKRDKVQPFRLHNLTLRHKVCTKRVARVIGTAANRELELLYEKMIESDYKLCIVCHVSWVGREPDELCLFKGDVAHIACAKPLVE